MALEDCLPEDLRASEPTLTRIAAGLSGAGVYRVDAGGQSYVLKVAADDERPEGWRRALHFQRLAAEAGLTPRVVHADEARRAVLTDFLVDRSFFAFYATPSTRVAAVDALGQTARRIHALPMIEGDRARDPREVLAEVRDDSLAGFTLPALAASVIEGMLDEVPPPNDRPKTLCHNDLNPGNLAYDGAAMALGDFYQAMQRGELKLGTPAGQWAFGLALFEEARQG